MSGDYAVALGHLTKLEIPGRTTDLHLLYRQKKCLPDGKVSNFLAKEFNLFARSRNVS